MKLLISNSSKDFFLVKNLEEANRVYDLPKNFVFDLLKTDYVLALTIEIDIINSVKLEYCCSKLKELAVEPSSKIEGNFKHELKTKASYCPYCGKELNKHLL